MDNMDGAGYLPAFRAPGESEEPGVSEGAGASEGSQGSAWLLAIENRRILMKTLGDKITIPYRDELKGILLGSRKEEVRKVITEDTKEKIETNKEDTETTIDDIAEEYIGSYGGHGCYCTKISEGGQWPEGFQLVELRELTALTGDPGLFILSGAANHILHWTGMNQYCGRCGHKTVAKKEERAMACGNCGNVIYPRISPATITAILRGDQILLAHNRNFGQDLYSLIAGYVEPGESLEQCVEREIREEVGIKVKNIRYFGSQPWSFPDSLMIAFIAEYDSGEIEVDKIEIDDARWYPADDLPLIPGTDSVAGKMIRWFRGQYIKEE